MQGILETIHTFLKHLTLSWNINIIPSTIFKKIFLIPVYKPGLSLGMFLSRQWVIFLNSPFYVSCNFLLCARHHAGWEWTGLTPGCGQAFSPVSCSRGRWVLGGSGAGLSQFIAIITFNVPKALNSSGSSSYLMGRVGAQHAGGLFKVPVPTSAFVSAYSPEPHRAMLWLLPSEWRSLSFGARLTVENRGSLLAWSSLRHQQALCHWAWRVGVRLS